MTKPILLIAAGLLLCHTLATGQAPDDLAMKAPGFSLGNLFNCKKELRAGTPLLLETLDPIATESATVGQSIGLRVREAVEAEGRTVIAAGALAVGRVKAIEPGTYNRPERLHLEALSVVAVDGSQVPLLGEASWQAPLPNQPLELPPSSVLLAQVGSGVKVGKP